MGKTIDEMIETGRDLYEAGIMEERTLIDLVDLRANELEEDVAMLEKLVRELVYVLWCHQDCSDGEDVAKVLSDVPSQYLEFML